MNKLILPVDEFMTFADAHASNSQFQYTLTDQARQDRERKLTPVQQPKKRKAANVDKPVVATKKKKVTIKSTVTQIPQQPKLALEDEYFVKLEHNSDELIKPSFYNYCYTLKPVTSDNTLTLHINEFDKIHNMNDYETNMYICLQHGLMEKPLNGCPNCIQFDKFPFSFIIETKNNNFAIFPPPERYVSKNFNYFRYLIKEMAQQPIINDTDDEWMETKRNAKEENAYNEFIKNEFKGGQIQSIISGKKSYIRNRILGFHSHGLRLTLTIDSLLPAHYISIPHYVYKTLDLLTPLVLVNRAPSINDGCLYVCELLFHEDDDPTIHLSPFMTERLHADQDGDDLTILYLRDSNCHIEPTEWSAILELKHNSWRYGRRYGFDTQSRYRFTQYHRYLLHLLSDDLAEVSGLWRRVRDAYKENPKQIHQKIIELGSTTEIDEFDRFIEQFYHIIKNIDPIMVNTYDLITGEGLVKAVVDSGAKGRDEHIKVYLENLYKPELANYKQELIQSFDRYIDASNHIGNEGAKQFILLYAMSSIYLMGDNIYSNNRVILENVMSSDLTRPLFFNKTAIRDILLHSTTTMTTTMNH